MGFLINFLRNPLYKLKGGQDQPSSKGSDLSAAPRVGIIKKEPLLATQDGYLVMIVDHTFTDIPSWVEWDAERGVISFAEAGGGVDEAKAKIKTEHLVVLEQTRKVLLVSNDGDKVITHYIPFVAR